MRASKLKAAKVRDKLKLEKARLDIELETNAERLKSLVGGFGFAGYVPKSKKRNEYSPPKVEYRNYVGFTPKSPDPVHVDKEKRVYTEEEMIRELKAQQEIHEKKKLSMPLYNKGPVQWPTVTDLEAMKNGELRRRS
jgi:hypothetical protein